MIAKFTVILPFLPLAFAAQYVQFAEFDPACDKFSGGRTPTKPSLQIAVQDLVTEDFSTANPLNTCFPVPILSNGLENPSDPPIFVDGFEIWKIEGNFMKQRKL